MTNVTPASKKKELQVKSPHISAKKPKIDVQFERLVSAVEGSKQISPLATEINDLLIEAESICDKKTLLEIKGNLKFIH